MSEVLLSFRREVLSNQKIFSRKRSPIRDYFNMKFNLMFNANINLNMIPNDELKKFLEECRRKLEKKYGDQLINRLESEFERIVKNWVMSLNERVAKGENWCELVEKESPKVGMDISHRIDGI